MSNIPRIAIIEDDKELARDISLKLQAQGYKTLIANSFQEGLEILKNNTGVAIINIKLPDGNGIDLAYHIKLNYPDVHIIITGVELKLKQTQQLLEIGIKKLLIKPYDTLTFLEVIKTSFQDYMTKQTKRQGELQLEKSRIEYRKLQELIKYNAYHDRLTGLYNRTYFEEELKRINTKRNYPISIISIDVNHLKIINDTWGHSAGDEILRYFGDSIKNCVRQDDVVARIGGDEFVILLKQTNQIRTEEIIKKLKIECKKCKDYSLDRSEKININYAIGSVTITEFDKESLNKYISRADEEMYRDKMDKEGTAQKEFINSLIEVMKQKDIGTQIHHDRLVRLGAKFAKRLHLSLREVRDLHYTIKFHDIGKIGVPDRILHKKEPLTKKEWEKLKTHPILGYNILKGVRQFSHIADYILRHHEKWDGTGYPDGLEGENIPSLSRITAILDSYDTMTHKRLHDGDPKTKEQAMEELEKERGKQFDPELVDVFLQILREKGTKKEK